MWATYSERQGAHNLHGTESERDYVGQYDQGRPQTARRSRRLWRGLCVRGEQAELQQLFAQNVHQKFYFIKATTEF